MTPDSAESQGKAGAEADAPQALKVAVALAIRALREEARLSRAMLAERSGLSSSWISRLESGKHEPTYNSLRRLAGGLGVPLSRLAKAIEDSNRASGRRGR